MDLLPSDFSEFRAKSYWDRFFRLRKGRAFEWYGEWPDLRTLLEPHLLPRQQPPQQQQQDEGTALTDLQQGQQQQQQQQTQPPVLLRVLVPGCGNSELSAALYNHLQGAANTSSSGGGGGTKSGNGGGSSNGGSSVGVCGVDFSITNIDFSPVVVKEMKRKHADARPGMTWLEMDMTATSFDAGSFDVVVDKGGLDALMGEPGDEAEEAGARFLDEMARVLSAHGGRYVCVTLGQEHVARTLFERFRSPTWSVSVHNVVVIAQPLHSAGAVGNGNGSHSSGPTLNPFVVVARRTEGKGGAGGGSEDGGVGAVRTSFSLDEPLPGYDEEQLAGLRSAIARENSIRFQTQTPSPATTCSPEGAAAAAAATNGSEKEEVQQQQLLQQQFPEPVSESDLQTLRQFRPGRRLLRSLGSSSSSSSPLLSSSSSTSSPSPSSTSSPPLPSHSPLAVHPLAPRFLITILDVGANSLRDAATAIPCAVFLVPQGREHEWLFSSEEGQWELATSANAKRLILVTLNRGHSFGSCQEVQDELSPLVLPLAPDVCRLPSGFAKPIPYMTTGDGIGWRRIVEETESPMTGPIVVEDVRADANADADADSTRASVSSTASTQRPLLRRLVFRRNANLVQSEAVLVPLSSVASHAPASPAVPGSATASTSPAAAAAAAASKAAAATSGGRKGKGKKKGGGGTGRVGGSGMDQLRGPKGGGAGGSAQEIGAGEGEWQVDHSQLASSYHAAMIAGMALQGASLLERMTSALTSAAAATPSPSPSSHSERAATSTLMPAAAAPTTAPQLTALVVGLGGGALPMFLRKHFPFTRIAVVELDPAIVRIAKSHFGLVEDSVLKTTVADGAVIVQSGAEAASTSTTGSSGGSSTPTASTVSSRSGGGDSSGNHLSETVTAAAAAAGAPWDIVFIDADSDDVSSGMSCPAPVFLEREFLAAARAALRAPHGMLALNVVARSAGKYRQAVESVKEVFADIYEINVDGDVNRVLFACKGLEGAAAKDDAISSPASRDPLPAAGSGAEGSAGAAPVPGMKLAAVRLVAAASKFAPWGQGPSLVKVADGFCKL